MHAVTRLLFVVLVVLIVRCAVAADPPPTGPETEKRFPPLVVPAGFKATLFACDPLIEYPSGDRGGAEGGDRLRGHRLHDGPGDRDRPPQRSATGARTPTATAMRTSRRRFRRRLQFDRGDHLARRRRVCHARAVSDRRAMTRDGDGKAEERKDLLTRPGADAGGKPGAAALRQRRRRGARRLAVSGPRRSRLRREAAGRGPAGASMAAASSAAGRTAAICTSSPAACGTSTTWPSTPN